MSSRDEFAGPNEHYRHHPTLYRWLMAPGSNSYVPSWERADRARALHEPAYTGARLSRAEAIARERSLRDMRAGLVGAAPVVSARIRSGGVARHAPSAFGRLRRAVKHSLAKRRMKVALKRILSPAARIARMGAAAAAHHAGYRVGCYNDSLAAQRSLREG